MDARYALYFAPRLESEWWRFGSSWLGRDAATDERLDQPAIAGMAPELFAALTAEPRKYGFHATLKAPMRLAPGATRERLISSLRELCADRPAFALPPLKVARLRHFLALVPDGDTGSINALANAVVERFDRFRAPATETDLAKRRAQNLSSKQSAYLEWWGYPYVFEEYRFHMTLSGSLTEARALLIDAMRDAAEAAVRELNRVPLAVDAVCLFEQRSPDTAFVLSERVEFKSFILS